MKRSIIIGAALSIALVLSAGCGSSSSTAGGESASQDTEATSAPSVDTGALALWMSDHEPDAENYLDIPDKVLSQWSTAGPQACGDIEAYLNSALPPIPPIPDAGLNARFQEAVGVLTADVDACSAPGATRDDAVKLRGDADAINKVLSDTLVASKS